MKKIIRFLPFIFFLYSLDHCKLDYQSCAGGRFLCNEGHNFAECVDIYKEKVRECRVDLDSAGNGSIDGYVNSDYVVKYNSPVELLPAITCPNEKKGIVLVHGWTDSPYHIRSVGEFFQSKCFTVRMVLLPGHGTIPDDLVETNHIEWTRAVTFAMDSFLKDDEFSQRFIGGFSTGAGIALHLAVDKYSTAIDAIFLFSPLVATADPFSAFAHSVSKFKPWYKREDETDFFQYGSSDFHSIGEVYQVTVKLQESLSAKKSKIPVFMALYLEDQTIHAESAIQAFKKDMISRKSKMLLYHTAEERPNFADERIEYMHAVDFNRNIISISHGAIPIDSNDPHYGIEGAFKKCLHYAKDDPKRQRCLLSDPNSDSSTTKWGDATEENLGRYELLVNIKFNPFFSELKTKINDFLDKLSP